MAISISAYEPMYSQRQQRIVPGYKPYEYEFYRFMEGIQRGEYLEAISKLRAIDDKNERAAFKAQNLLAVTLSCVCLDSRKEANITAHTGLMGIDIDPDESVIDDWGALRDAIVDRIPVVAAALSASGKGVFFVIKVPKELSIHRDIYTYVSWKIKEVFDLRVDPTGKNPDRLRFTSYDPDCYINYNIDTLPEIIPDAEYWKRQSEDVAQQVPLLGAAGPDSVNVFRNGITIAQTATPKRPTYDFVDGQKHPFLVVVASHCNARGMSEARCKQLTEKLFKHKSSLTSEELLRPIDNVYKTYSQEFGKFPLPVKPVIPIVHKRWLLQRVEKQYLRDNLFFYGSSTIHGPSGQMARVSSKLLVFLMHLYAPQHSWTCEPCAAPSLSNADCASVFRDDCKISIVAGEVAFVEKDFGYPKSWDE